MDKPADDERALKLMLLHSLYPEFFSLCVYFEDLPIRKSHCWGRSNHIRFTRIGGYPKIWSLGSRWVNIHVVAKR